jgi:hypothetical protein
LKDINKEAALWDWARPFSMTQAKLYPEDTKPITTVEIPSGLPYPQILLVGKRHFLFDYFSPNGDSPSYVLATNIFRVKLETETEAKKQWKRDCIERALLMERLLAASPDCPETPPIDEF